MLVVGCQGPAGMAGAEAPAPDLTVPLGGAWEEVARRGSGECGPLGTVPVEAHQLREAAACGEQKG